MEEWGADWRLPDMEGCRGFNSEGMVGVRLRKQNTVDEDNMAGMAFQYGFGGQVTSR